MIGRLFAALAHVFTAAIRNQPLCFGSNPGVQARAENCCDDCPWERTCQPPRDPATGLAPGQMMGDP